VLNSHFGSTSISTESDGSEEQTAPSFYERSYIRLNVVNLYMWIPFSLFVAFVIPDKFSAKFKITDPFTNYQKSFQVTSHILMELEIIVSTIFPHN
jgi:hypothetical protein